MRHEKLESLTVSFLGCSGLSLLTLFERGEQERRPEGTWGPFFCRKDSHDTCYEYSIDLLAENGGDHNIKYGRDTRTLPAKNAKNSEKGEVNGKPYDMEVVQVVQRVCWLLDQFRYLDTWVPDSRLGILFSGWLMPLLVSGTV